MPDSRFIDRDSAITIRRTRTSTSTSTRRTRVLSTGTQVVFGSPNTDIMFGSQPALHVVANTLHEARPHSQHPRSAYDPSTWNQPPHPSLRYVMSAFTVHGSHHLSLYVRRHAPPALRRRRHRRRDVSSARPNYAVDRLISA